MKIYICGDSTAASYSQEEAPMVGWGQVLGEIIDVPVENRAMAGRSSKSYLAEGRLQKIETDIEPGDLLLIQFTHNDTSDLVWRHTDPWTSFLHCLSIYVDTARQNQAVPVLLTPICVRSWEGDVLQESHGVYPDAVRHLALERNVPLIDLYQESKQYLRKIGEEASRKLYMNVEKGIYPRYPDGQTDNTHTQRAGAEAWAGIVAEKLKALGLI